MSDIMPVAIFVAIIDLLHQKFQGIYETRRAPYEKFNDIMLMVESGPYNETDVIINRKQNEIFIGKHILLRKVPDPDDPDYNDGSNDPENPTDPVYYRKLVRSVRIHTDSWQKNEYIWSAWGDNSRKMKISPISAKDILKEIIGSIVWTNEK